MCKYSCGYSKSQVTGALNNCFCSHFASLFKDVHIGQKKVGCGKKREQLRPKTFQWPKTVKGHYSLPLDNCNSLGGMFCPASSSLRYPGQERLCLYSVILWSPWIEKGIMEFAPWLKRSHSEMMHVISAVIFWLKQVIWPHLTSRKWGLAILPSEKRKFWKEEKPEVFGEQCWWPPQFLFSPCWMSGRDTKSYCSKTYS